jgi:hypothetical protein
VNGADVVSLAEFRAAHRAPDDDLPPSAPHLWLVGDEDPPDPLRLDLFLARARIVMAETRRQQMHVVSA